MLALKRITVYAILILAAGALLTAVFGTPTELIASHPHEIPSLTAWGKIFSVLLLAALGVAYLVWRRPIAQAQAILETSPLGVDQPASPLIDWRLYFKTLVIMEAVAILAILVVRLGGRPLSTIDYLGVLASAAIVALVVHLLILARTRR